MSSQGSTTVQLLIPAQKLHPLVKNACSTKYGIALSLSQCSTIHMLRLYLISPLSNLKCSKIFLKISIWPFLSFRENMFCRKFKCKHHQKLENTFSKQTHPNMACPALKFTLYIGLNFTVISQSKKKSYRCGLCQLSYQNKVSLELSESFHQTGQ